MEKKIEWDKKNVLITITGNTSFLELRELGSNIYGDHRFDVINYLFIDFRLADLSQITSAHVKTIASIDSVSVTYKPELKMAFIINSEEKRKLCETYIEYSKNFQTTWSFAIFTSLEEANKWCELK